MINKHTRALLDFKSKLFDRVQLRNADLAHALRDIRLDWYRISNVAEDEEKAEVFIYDEIGGSFGVDATEFVTELKALDVKEITVRINSPGGSLFDSIAIHNALVQHKAKIITRIDALAASGASIIAMAGDEVEMMNGSQLMIHDALGFELGNAAAFEAMARFLNLQSDNIADMYKARAGGTREEWRSRMLAETWMFADEAIELGLADKVYVKPAPPDDGEEEIVTEVENTVSEELDISALIIRPHRVDNRGFKYAGREDAPSPVNSSDPWNEVRALVATWKER